MLIYVLYLGKEIITKSKALDLIDFDITVIPGCKICARCSSDLSAVLNGSIESSKIIQYPSPNQKNVNPCFENILTTKSIEDQRLHSVQTQVQNLL